MKTQTAILIALFALSGAAQAEINADSVVAEYQAQGFTRIEVRSGRTQTKVEAIRGTEKLEVVLDNATGTVLKTETGTVGAFENTAPGVSIRDRNRDFVRVSTANGATGDGSADDDGSDHVSGDDDGADHDAGDDQGGDHDDAGDGDGDHESAGDGDGDHESAGDGGDDHESAGDDGDDHESADNDGEDHDGAEHDKGEGKSDGSGDGDD